MEKMMKDKVAIVTGGSKGIGQAIAEMYAAEGAKLVITARGKEALDAEVAKLKAQGAEVIGIVADQKKAEDTERVFKTTLDTYGDFDVVVVNAGVGEQVKVEATPDELFREVFEINALGAFRFVREAVKHFLPKKVGSIIVVSSVNGARPMCGVSYTTSKGAVNTMIKNVAIRLVGTGVRINGILPGFTVTPLSTTQEGGTKVDAANFNALDERQRMAPPEEYSMLPILHTRTVRGISAQAEDPAYAAVFFGSEMSRSVNGQLLIIDNGCYL